MPPRILSFVLIAAMIGLASPASAKTQEKKKSTKQTARSWKTLVEHVLKNGDDDPLLGATARTLGYASDEIYAKSLGIDEDKSKDHREHGIFVVAEKEKSGVLVAKEIVLGAIAIKAVGIEKEINSYRVRLNLDGTIIGGLHATGIVGEVVHKALPKDSKELISMYNAESALYLKEIDLAQLTK